MKKRTVALMMALVLVVGVAVGGTIAWLTDGSKQVVNSFSTGDIAIDLWETKVDAYGDVVEGADPVKANSYQLVPGETYTKDPYITVEKGSEPCYVYVAVKNDLASQEAGSTIAAQMLELGWVALNQNDVNGYPLYYKAEEVDAREAAKTVQVFTQFTLKGDADLSTVTTDTQIVVVAYAVQSANLTDAATAWNTGAPAAWKPAA